MTGKSELADAPRSRFALPKTSTGVLAEDLRSRALTHVRSLLEAPTAPYFEDGPLQVVRRFVDERPGLELVEDAHSNLVVTWRGTEPKRTAPRVAFSAHLDHPGFHYAGRSRGVHRATFHGGVPARFMPGCAVRFFTPAGKACATARVRTATARGAEGIVVELEQVRGQLARGSYGVFDLQDGVMRGARLAARVCDDLMGAAAILATLDHCVATLEPRSLAGIFTRAEETGFIGCIGLLEAGLLAPETAVVGLECSPRRSTARVGRGPVIRVGDRLSVFDPAITLELQDAASRVSARAPKFQTQRALMDGGSCESTAYNAWGMRAGAMCLALGNYHNCGPNQTIAAEFVDWNDFEGLVAIMIECARAFEAGPSHRKMQVRLKRSWDREYKRFAASSRRLSKVKSTRSKKVGVQR